MGYKGLIDCIYPNTVGFLNIGGSDGSLNPCDVGTCTFLDPTGARTWELAITNTTYTLARRCIAADECCAFYQHGNLTINDIVDSLGLSPTYVGCPLTVATGCASPATQELKFRFVGTLNCSGQAALFSTCCDVSYLIHVYHGITGKACLDIPASASGVTLSVDAVSLYIVRFRGVGVPGAPACGSGEYWGGTYATGSHASVIGALDSAPFAGLGCTGGFVPGGCNTGSVVLTGLSNSAPSGHTTLACCGGTPTISLNGG